MKKVLIAVVLLGGLSPAFADDAAWIVTLRGCKEITTGWVNERNDGMKWSPQNPYSAGAVSCKRVEYQPADGSQGPVALEKMPPDTSSRTLK